MLILPRQAWGKHRENSKKDGCLSRACLGKMSISMYKWRKKTVFLPAPASGSRSGGRAQRATTPCAAAPSRPRRTPAAAPRRAAGAS
eukprot:COSAG06_NODE_8625_length_2112_cov_1.090909_2_plen_87_part_00